MSLYRLPRRGRQPLRRVRCALPEDLIAWLDAQSQELGVSRNAVINALLDSAAHSAKLERIHHRQKWIAGLETEEPLAEIRFVRARKTIRPTQRG